VGGGGNWGNLFCGSAVVFLFEAQLAILDAWTPLASMPVKYFSGVATIANHWRSTTHGGKIKLASARLFNDDICLKCFGKIPHRCLRGRWLSVDSVEGILVKASPYIGDVFGDLWGEESKATARKKVRGERMNRSGVLVFCVAMRLETCCNCFAGQRIITPL
jgi:hypothetical protein